MSVQIRAGLVSVIVPVYNQADLIRDCVDSVLTQGKVEIELIVVDDGSTDQTTAVLDELATTHSALRLFKQAHQGSGAARETGRLNARGEFIQYLNCFERMTPGKLLAQVTALDRSPRVNIVCGKRSFVPRQTSVEIESSGRAYLFPTLLSTRCWRTGAPLYRRQFIDQIGPWLDVSVDETLEYEARMAGSGAEVLLLDEPSSGWIHALAVITMRPLDTSRLLAERSRVQARVFQFAQHYSQQTESLTAISTEDWQRYSDRLFEFARQCALNSMTTEARAMLTLAIDANGRKSPKHRLFIKLVAWFGWQTAAKLFRRRA